MRASSLLVLALAGLAHAAPAPFVRPAPEQAPVLLTGWLSEQRLIGNPSVIACQTDYEAAAKALGIQNPPRVNFETHFLFINVSSGYGRLRCTVDGNGDLSAAGDSRADYNFERLGGFGRGGPSGPRYLIQSFPRSAVKTVNGAPLPRR